MAACFSDYTHVNTKAIGNAKNAEIVNMCESKHLSSDMGKGQQELLIVIFLETLVYRECAYIAALFLQECILRSVGCIVYQFP